jgi:adenine-specific DNA-methyltransferase
MHTTGVKYIGSKQKLLGDILEFVEAKHPTPGTMIDVFAGTTRVGQAFRSKGWNVQSSDLSWASEVYAHAFLIRTETSGTRIPALLEQLKTVAPTAGWLTNSYCEATTTDGTKINMWTRVNGMKADAIRDTIAAWEAAQEISHHEAMILTACLIVALDKVDSSVGVQQAYLKKWASRALKPLALQDLPFSAGPPGTHLVGDALAIPYTQADVAYIDPPYSAHSYATYYHIWDSIARWDKPQVGLKTNRRMDRVAGSFDSGMVSLWNSKKTAKKAFMDLVERLPVRYVVISYNDESLVPLSELEAALRTKWTIEIQKIAYKRNIMCQIGNAENKTDKKTENTEVLIWVQKWVAVSAASP